MNGKEIKIVGENTEEYLCVFGISLCLWNRQRFFKQGKSLQIIKIYISDFIKINTVQVHHQAPLREEKGRLQMEEKYLIASISQKTHLKCIKNFINQFKKVVKRATGLNRKFTKRISEFPVNKKICITLFRNPQGANTKIPPKSQNKNRKERSCFGGI